MRKLLRFGEIALSLGFVHTEHVEEALRVQRERDEAGRGHAMLGLVLLELGHIDSDQLIRVLRAYQGQPLEQRAPGALAEADTLRARGGDGGR